MKISSPAFADKGFIPIEYTQEGEDLSPPLVISDIPEAAKSLVLIVEDPDAPDPENPKLILPIGLFITFLRSLWNWRQARISHKFPEQRKV